MKKIINIFILLCVFLGMPEKVYADTNPSITIPVELLLKGDLPNPDEDYVIKFKADDPTNPMPAGAKNGEYDLKITGANKKDVPKITYTQVGIYTYTIEQVKGNNQLCTYDSTVYKVKVVISNASSNSKSTGSLASTTILYTVKESEKLTKAQFTNSYPVVPTVNPAVSPVSPSGNGAGNSAAAAGQNGTGVSSEVDPSSSDVQPLFNTVMPNTGDESHMYLYMVLALGSLVGMWYLVLKEYNREEI